MEPRYSEAHKLWLFDLAHNNIEQDEEVLKGFIKFYVLNNCTICNVQDDIIFHTNYGDEGVKAALTRLHRVLEDIVTK